MENKGWSNKVFVSLLLLMLWVVPSQPVFSQNSQVNLEIELSQVLENSQVLSLTGLGLNTDGSGPVLISGFLENLTQESIRNLYFEFKMRGAKVGTILELTQKNSRPFSLGPNQSVYATNNDLANDRIPGIEENISFNGGLTSAGEGMINNLSGSTSLPRDIYTIEVSVFQVTNEMGRQALASASAEIGGGLSFFDASEIYLKSPGDVAGTEAEITNPYPQFSWEGESNTTYRLLVVESNGEDSPESLLQSAKSSSPTSSGGSLLQFENLDVLIENDSYQFPSSGVQALKKGKLYYWQVITTVQMSGDTEERSSEIWSFSLSGTESGGVTIPEDQNVREVLLQLLGEERYNRLNESGYKLGEIEIDGQIFSGPIAAQQLEMILEKIRNEQIILNN
ncbi:MAG: hypothetical protein WEA79_02135 [Balneolaceae bacterium]